MKPKLNLDAMADELAGYVVEIRCRKAGEKALIEAVTAHIEKRPKRRKIDFAEYYRFLATHEAKFMRGLKSIWAGERRQMIANMKRTPKIAMAKGILVRISWDIRKQRKGPEFNALFDQWLYPQGPAKKALEKAYKDVATKLIQQAGKREATKYDLSVNWDVFNPNVDKWLKGYAPKYSGEIEGTSYDELKGKLLEGWEAGESIPDLTKRVNEVFDGWEKWRAERIARSESITSASRGAIETYRASEVVDRKMWLSTPDERECALCSELDGQIRELDESFFDADYGDGQGPARHLNCRCAILPILEGEEI